MSETTHLNGRSAGPVGVPAPRPGDIEQEQGSGLGRVYDGSAGKTEDPAMEALTDGGDAERVAEAGPRSAGAVDPPEEPRRWGPGTEPDRPPVVPLWLRSSQGRRGYVRWALREGGYVVGFHALRLPKYAAKAAWYAPRGVGRAVSRVVRWAMAEDGNWQLRQAAANRSDRDAGELWLKLDARRQRQARWRWSLVTAALVTGGAGGLAVWLSGVADRVPVAGWCAALAVLVLVAARLGRPVDKPITDRVTTGQRFVRLTAEMVRTALCSLGIAAIRDPKAITFPPPGIHRDGPGWLARVNLPAGVEAVEVMDRRGRLSSALRLPVDQVWPMLGPDHNGQLDLWVGYQPASKMGQPAWSLTAPDARCSVFEAAEFGTDQRQRPVATELFARNFLIGGVPGSGKSFAARTLATIAALDPTAEMKIVEFKGTGDFADMAPLCSTYACGVTEKEFGVGLEVLNWGLAEAERRGERIRKARERGQAPEGKVTPDLAARPGSGLHPVVIVIDEVHELFGDPTVGKEAAIAAERLIKRGRALGLIVVLATQIPDAKSLPSNITRCVTMRWCLAVQDQVANDMILGTGAYKRGLTGTVYRPGVDAGWGVLTGLAEPTAVRSHFPDPETAAAILDRATALRGGQVVGSTDANGHGARDVLADVRAMFDTAEGGLHWETIAARLAERLPDAYPAITPEVISAQLRTHGVDSVNVKTKGVVRKGARLADITKMITQRNQVGE